MNIAKKSAALLVLGLAALPLNAFATPVKVTGQAAEVAGDKGATLKAVKRDARRKAVEKGAGVLVKSNTIVRNYQMVSDEIATSSTGILTREQFGKMVVKDGVASIDLAANVDEAAVEGAICTVIKANHNPRVAFMFVERRIDGNDSFSNVGKAQRGTIESMLVESLVDNCFTVVESGVKVTEVAANGDVPQEMIDKAIENANAQYLLVGTGTITRNGDNALNKNLRTFSFDASVKLINVDTHQIEVVASSSKIMSGMFTLSSALKSNTKLENIQKGDYGRTFKSKRNGNVYMYNKDIFVNRIMGTLFDKISKKWAQELTNVSMVQIEVVNVKKFKHLNSFKKVALATFKDSVLENAKLRRGKATMSIDGIDGGADAFAAKLEGKKVGGLTIEVTEVSGGKVVLTLVK